MDVEKIPSCSCSALVLVNFCPKIPKVLCFQITVARSSVDSILWSCYVMIGFVMTANLSQLKIAQLRSKNKRTLRCLQTLLIFCDILAKVINEITIFDKISKVFVNNTTSC